MVKAMVRKPVEIRALRRDDLQAVTEIDEVIRGFARPGYWNGRFDGALGIAGRRDG
jgi:hypothetical protein